ncbi:MAG: hypothetical protein JST39_09375, partial [Bacteroidetes bacterium]|nr:hypothetical protein [Bacteroidota bacterium]
DVHIVTFGFILLIIGIIIVSLRLFESGDDNKRKLSLRIDRWAFFTTMILYAIINIWLVCKAIYGAS